jgi:glutamate synthase domain-containing protein 1
MCGIVGLHLRDPELYPQLGHLLTGMLCEMEERGADSAGVAVYGDPVWSPPGHATVSLLDVGMPASEVVERVFAHLDEAEVTVLELDATCVVRAPVAPEVLLAATRAGVLAAAFGLEGAQGWQGVGHTRMATESAVTPSGAHPYAVGPDQCLVHNGSFANHATIRRDLRARGVIFDSENDTEVGARYVAQALADGLDIETALKGLCAEFDGFYTLLVSNRDSFAVVRDAIACKPAVIAETDAWVAMASEYRALVGLPGIEQAHIFEPEPERIYAWTR